MAKNTQLANATVNGQADNLSAQLNNGYLRIYTGSQPTNADTALGAQVLLAELRFNATAAPAASAGVITFNAITGAAALAQGQSTDATGSALGGPVVGDVATGQGQQIDGTGMAPSPHRGGGRPGWHFVYEERPIVIGGRTGQGPGQSSGEGMVSAPPPAELKRDVALEEFLELMLYADACD